MNNINFRVLYLRGFIVVSYLFTIVGYLFVLLIVGDLILNESETYPKLSIIIPLVVIAAGVPLRRLFRGKLASCEKVDATGLHP
jgi:hypothetical protein